AEAQVFIQELLVANLTPAVRAWVLLLSGEASRAQGDLDDARTQYDLGRRADPATATGWLAGLRHAQVNFEMREFAQAARDLSGLVATAPSAEARALVLVLQAEAGYHAGQYAAAGAAFRRALVEFPSHPQAGAARLGVAWTALRQDRDDGSRRGSRATRRRRSRRPSARGWARWRRSGSPRRSSRRESSMSRRACSRTRATRVRRRSRTPRSTASRRSPSRAAPTKTSSSRRSRRSARRRRGTGRRGSSTSWRGSPSRRRIGLAPWSFPSGSPTSSPPTRRRTTSSR